MNPYDRDVYQAEKNFDRDPGNAMSAQESAEAWQRLHHARAMQQAWNSGRPTSDAAGTGALDGGGLLVLLRWLVTAFLFAVIWVTVMSVYREAEREWLIDNSPTATTALPLFEFDPTPWLKTGPSRSIDSAMTLFQEQFQQRYGTLFQANTPWEQLYRECQPQKDPLCLRVPLAGVQRLQAHARQPSTLWEDMCTINGRAYFDSPIARLYPIQWKAVFPGTATPRAEPTCQLADPERVAQIGSLYQTSRQTGLLIIAISVGLLASLLSVCLLYWTTPARIWRRLRPRSVAAKR